jgi:hypothetical protein
VLVAGSNLDDTESQLASDPAGLELIDTRRWIASVLDPQADSFTVVNGLLLATGARWRGNVNPTGMGVAAYGPDGKKSYSLFAGHDVWIDHIVNGRAYIGGYGWKSERIIDLSTGRIIGTRTTAAAPMLLLGLGNPLG